MMALIYTLKHIKKSSSYVLEPFLGLLSSDEFHYHMIEKPIDQWRFQSYIH